MGTLYLTDGDDLTTVANAIRAKSGGSSQLAFPAGFVSEIQAIPTGGGGTSITVETVDVTVDNVRQTAITIPVTSTDYDNIVATFSVTDTWHYDNDVAVKDDVPTFPSNSDGFDFCGAFVKMAAMQRFTGYTYTYLRTDYPPVYKMSVASRNSATPQAYGGTTGIMIYADSIKWDASRAFCQLGYKVTFRFKILFWDD